MSQVQAFASVDATPQMLVRIRQLLERSFGAGFSADDWDHTVGGDHFVISEGDILLAHAAVVPRTLTIGDLPIETGYVEGVATEPQARGRGLGSAVMTEAAAVIRARYEMGALSSDRHTFYERLGWERWRGLTYVRRGDELLRTEGEDDGLMVLRFGPSAVLDPTAAICCNERSGDDW